MTNVHILEITKKMNSEVNSRQALVLLLLIIGTPGNYESLIEF